MQSNSLLHPVMVYLLWTVLLYALLTIARAPAVWGMGARKDNSNPWADIEPRISQNLRNQFEWPVLFYAICVLLMATETTIPGIYIWLAWVFVVGRLIHSAVQILTTNIRLRGIVFTVNFVAVVCMWLVYYWDNLGTTRG